MGSSAARRHEGSRDLLHHVIEIRRNPAGARLQRADRHQVVGHPEILDALPVAVHSGIPRRHAVVVVVADAVATGVDRRAMPRAGRGLAAGEDCPAASDSDSRRSGAPVRLCRTWNATPADDRERLRRLGVRTATPYGLLDRQGLALELPAPEYVPVVLDQFRWTGRLLQVVRQLDRRPSICARHLADQRDGIQPRILDR